MLPFKLNGDFWQVMSLEPDDPRLIDRTGERRLATTDPTTHCVYLSELLEGRDLETVLLHEIGHCALHSYGLLPAIHSVVPEDGWVTAEEWVCNYVANYGREIIQAANTSLGYSVMEVYDA